MSIILYSLLLSPIPIGKTDQSGSSTNTSTASKDTPNSALSGSERRGGRRSRSQSQTEVKMDLESVSGSERGGGRSGSGSGGERRTGPSPSLSDTSSLIEHENNVHGEKTSQQVSDSDVSSVGGSVGGSIGRMSSGSGSGSGSGERNGNTVSLSQHTVVLTSKAQPYHPPALRLV